MREFSQEGKLYRASSHGFQTDFIDSDVHFKMVDQILELRMKALFDKAVLKWLEVDAIHNVLLTF